MRANVLNVLTKVTGAAGLGLVLYDAHHYGKTNSHMGELDHKAHQLKGRYMDEMMLDKPSIIKQEAKHKIFNFFVHEKMSEPYVLAKGYGDGFMSMLTQHIVPFGLSIGALVTRGVASKFCGLGLLAYGAMFLAEEIAGPHH